MANDFQLELFSVSHVIPFFRVRHLLEFLFLPALGNNLSTYRPCFFQPFPACGNNMSCPEI